MSAINSLLATQPDINATVSASAGSGKTWLLVTRIIKLLLQNAEPGSILGLTFTRKAASEMQIRLHERLYELATIDEIKLIKLLEELDVTPDISTLQKAKKLYEELLHAAYPVRLKTFHSFCQDILSRFPLEADIPPGFELAEETSLLETQAWDSLFAEATNNPGSTLAQDLDCLMLASNGPPNTRKALNSMLRQRSDWWAFTENQPQPTNYAYKQLQQQLQLKAGEDPLRVFFSHSNIEALKEFAQLLTRHKTATNMAHAALLECISDSQLNASTLRQVQQVFLSASGEPRKRKASKAQNKSMGDAGEQQFLNHHIHLCEQLLETLDHLARLDTLELNGAWYRAGHRYIEIFQRLKRELRILDFADLEWNCYRLLNTSDNAHWVQYKTDQRIDHFLIDEFQDTNPTQWQLLSPLFEEIASGPGERWRTVFLVGDKKQSIYSFRRANPELQSQASDWLRKNLSAQNTPLDYSWRSSPAIINFVNHVFSQPALKNVMPDFKEHGTHLEDLPGSVTLYPLCQETETGDELESPGNAGELELRNPLLEPRVDPSQSAYTEEADIIAKHIHTMVTEPRYIRKNGSIRAIDYGDIMILLRARSHANDYEKALREYNIPFVGDQQGTLLENLEIQDMEKLLNVLVTPFDNLALAQVLKSPLFDATDDDLILLSEIKNSPYWFQKLSQLPEDYADNAPLKRASRLLPRWHQLADSIPVHDLLDKVYAEGNILKRYISATPDSSKKRVQANLQRFIELSLELDSGRYPSLSHFLNYLRNIRKQQTSAPDEPVINTGDSRVRIMTIHASKGLESPVVFLADCNRGNSDTSAFTTLVHWPEHSKHPDRFQLLTDKKSQDKLTRQVQKIKNEAEQREQLNLLYVALTRAREYLVITGVEPGSARYQSGWYSYLKAAMSTLHNVEQIDGIAQYSIGVHLPTGDDMTGNRDEIDLSNFRNPALTRPIADLPRIEHMIAPSRSDELSESISRSPGTTNSEPVDYEGKTRGIAIHRALDLMSKKSPLSINIVHRKLSAELNLQNEASIDEQELQDWINEAASIISAKQFTDIFSPSESSMIYNELAIMYKPEHDMDHPAVYGIIDRLVIEQDQILLIDYKTHSNATLENVPELATLFAEQMKLYRAGVHQLWPDHAIKTGLLFTACKTIFWLDGI